MMPEWAMMEARFAATGRIVFRDRKGLFRHRDGRFAGGADVASLRPNAEMILPGEVLWIKERPVTYH